MGCEAEGCSGLALSEEVLEAAALVGEALGPLTLLDPVKSPSASACYEAWRRLDVAAAAADWPLGGAGVADSLAVMQAGLEAWESEAFLWEYRALFVGPVGMAAPPYGSVYTDRDAVVDGDSTLRLRSWMRDHGLQERAGALDGGDVGRPLEDHIGRMLLLMAWLAHNEPALLPEFLDEHLLVWVLDYTDALEAAASNPFFSGLACLMRQSMKALAKEVVAVVR